VYNTEYEDTSKENIQAAELAGYIETRTAREQAALVYSNLAIVELLKEISARLESMEQALQQLRAPCEEEQTF
jgi:hypothetical protein